MKSIYTPEEAKSHLVNFMDKKFRKYQAETVSYIMDSTRKFKIVRAPCGSGKSLIAMVCGVMAGSLTYWVGSKFLQTQITNDFGNAVSMWGRNNYPCASDPTRNCDECLATETRPCQKACPYKQAKQKAIDAQYKILNFAYAFTEMRFAGRFSGAPFSVIDESDSLSDTLIQNVSLVFTERSLFRLGLTEGPSRKTVTSSDGLSSWKEFGKEAKSRSSNLANQITFEIESMDDSDPDQKLRKIREAKHFTHISEQCDTFLSSVDLDWKMEEIPRVGSRQAQLIFKPVWITPELSNEFIFKHSDSWTLLSATYPPLPVLCKQLGIDIDDVEGSKIYDVPSTFDPEKAPVYLWPVASLSASRMDTEVPKVISAVKKILDRHPGVRGLIHTVSYRLGQAIIDGVQSPRLIMHTSENRQDVINGFANKGKSYLPDDACLVSPSAERGLDFSDDLCRFVVCAKAPFKNLADKVTNARLYGSGPLGSLWYKSDMMCCLEQQSGRGVRSQNDYCSIYLLDEKINEVYMKQPSLWSENYRNQISWEPNQLLDENNS
jgi:Rad3-related DNA helicase